MIQKKVCMLGAFGVGKTSLVRRFVESIFDERYHTTVGVKIDKKVAQVGNQPVMLMIWDLAGEDDVEQIRMSHLRGSEGWVFVIDGCRRSTLDRSLAVQQRVTEAFGPLPFVVAVNKSDLHDEWQIEASELGVSTSDVFVTSAKTGAGVEQMFVRLAEKVLS
jgi:small GTP-binding protein